MPSSRISLQWESCSAFLGGAAVTALRGRGQPKGLVPFRDCPADPEPPRNELKIGDQLLLWRNVPSFAVAWKNGSGSSDFRAEVKALERDHMVRGMNSACVGSK
jgi:hypothetical protein